MFNVVRASAQRDMANISMLPADNPLLTSSHSMSLMGPGVSIENLAIQLLLLVVSVYSIYS